MTREINADDLRQQARSHRADLNLACLAFAGTHELADLALAIVIAERVARARSRCPQSKGSTPMKKNDTNEKVAAYQTACRDAEAAERAAAEARQYVGLPPVVAELEALRARESAAQRAAELEATLEVDEIARGDVDAIAAHLPTVVKRGRALLDAGERLKQDADTAAMDGKLELAATLRARSLEGERGVVLVLQAAEAAHRRLSERRFNEHGLRVPPFPVVSDPRSSVGVDRSARVWFAAVVERNATGTPIRGARERAMRIEKLEREERRLRAEAERALQAEEKQRQQDRLQRESHADAARERQLAQTASVARVHDENVAAVAARNAELDALASAHRERGPLGQLRSTGLNAPSGTPSSVERKPLTDTEILRKSDAL